MKNNKATRSINNTFLITALIPGLFLFLALGGSLTFASLYVFLGNHIYLYLLIGFVVVFSLAYFFSCLFQMRRLKVYYVEGLYKNTANLLTQLKNNSRDFTRYPDTNIKEINELNDELDVVSSIFENSTLISHNYNESNIPLEHIDGDESFVTLKSLKKYLVPLIYGAQNYRNVLAELYYDFNDDALNEDEIKWILGQLKTMFADYPYRLIALNEDNSGFYIFLPHIDSISHIEEFLMYYMKRLSVSKKTYDGLSTINARFSLVCYPYSDIGELFSDLRYAKRQGEVINVYLPNRLSSLSQAKLVQNSMNLNNVSRIIELLSDLRISTKDRNKSLSIIRKALTAFNNYFDVDYSGLIVLNDDDNRYYSNLVVCKDKPIFKEGQEMSKEFIDAFDHAVDIDCSYYFSARSHCNIELANQLDKTHMSSGFFFVSRDRGEPYAVIYFLNQNRDMQINSYLREGLFIASHRIGDYLLMARREDYFDDTYREINTMLLSNDSSLYRIDTDTYNILSLSSNFKALFKKAEIGKKCYECLYGLDSPCKDCPLHTSKKKYGEADGTKYIVSLSTNEKHSRFKRLLIQNVKGDETSYDRYDHDLLIASFPSLGIALRGLYSIGSRGYLLLLRIDNFEPLLKNLGSEKYLFLMRQFISNIKNINKNREGVYTFDNQSIAILLSECGQVEVVNIVEQIYEASKKEYKLDDKTYSFNVTYLPYSFPQSYPVAEDFLKYVIRHYNQRNYKINEDILFFPDGDYSRSASRDKFMLAVIDEQFGNKTFSVALQPMLRTSDKSIFGAEIFIRLSDNYRNMVFSADELIKTAARNGKISLISSALVKYIGELYTQFGLTVFKVYGFQRLTLNTDYSYFADPSFNEEIHNLLVDFHLPRDFLGFEITEREIYNHMEDLKKLSKGIISEHIALICDQYTGKYVSIEVLKQMGFSEVKIDRYIVNDIDVNKQHLSEVSSLIKYAESVGVKASLVGVENADQFILIKDISKNTNVQGYHFYRPLDKVKFIEELRKNS